MSEFLESAAPWGLLALVPVALVPVARSLSARRRARRRLFGGAGRAQVQAPGTQGAWSSWLERWLHVSGFRGRGALPTFLFWQAACLVAGALATLALLASPLLEVGQGWLLQIPGGVGELLAPVLGAAPAIVLLLVALLPVTRVRARRRAIVQAVERDLPISLALLATLVESGMGFDAAIDRLARSLDPDRPLARELALFRSENQAGVPRHDCFRRLARRLDVPAVSVFVSAMIHSEVVGGSISESLRRQADEVWNRRKSQAIQRAQTLPTKLAIPLVLCFLPGIFVYTLGPALAEFIRIAEGAIRG